MAALNLCQFIGNVGADPEIRTFEGGNRIATTRIAVTERFLDRNQQQQERTEWISIIFNGKLVDVVEKYVHKGSPIYVSGKLHNREWTDQSGNKRTSTELQANVLQLLEQKQQKSAPAQSAPAPNYPPQYQAPAQQFAAAPARPAPPAPAQYQAPAPQYPPQYQPQDNGPDLPF